MKICIRLKQYVTNANKQKKLLQGKRNNMDQN